MLTQLRHLARTEDTQVTIKFSKNAMENVKTSKEKLIASSGFCAEHWLDVSTGDPLTSYGKTSLTSHSIPGAAS
jgi:hypothetical protein